MAAAIDETDRRRTIQADHNEEHGITPQTIQKKILDLEAHIPEAEDEEEAAVEEVAGMPDPKELSDAALEDTIADLKKQMREAAKELQFELAASLRDQMRRYESERLSR